MPKTKKSPTPQQRTTRRRKTKPHGRGGAAAAAQVCDEPVPADADEFRRMLTRKISTFIGSYRRCREPLCKRTRRCAGPDLRCLRDDPAAPMSPDEQMRVKAEMLHLLQRELARRGRES